MKISVKNFLLIIVMLMTCGCISNNKSSTSSTDLSSNNFVSNHSTSCSSSSIIESSSSENEKNIMKTNYINPIFTKEEFADPAGIYCEKDNYYYLFATGGKIMRSKDMVNWTKRTNEFPSIPAWGTNGAGLWAPDVQYINGQYVMYYSLSTWGDSNPGIGVATASKPTGPWVDLGELFRSQNIGVNNSIDSMTFVDTDGKVYIVWGSMRGNYIVELTEDGLELKGGITEARKNKIRIAGLDTSLPWDEETYEGSYIIYENGYYYLFLSKGHCCKGLNSTYKVVVGRSKRVTGPYVDHEGRDMKNRGVGKIILDKNENFVGPGHNSLLKDQEGNYYIYYHTYTKEYTEYRVLAMERLQFDEEGWPYINDGTPSSSEMEGPTTFLNK